MLFREVTTTASGSGFDPEHVWAAHTPPAQCSGHFVMAMIIFSLLFSINVLGTFRGVAQFG